MFRLNMSHLARDRLRNSVQVIRAVEAKYRRPIGILADLQGPKLRVGAFSGEGAMLKRGQTTRRATPGACTCPIRRS